MTAPATSRPIGLAPGAPEEAAGQDAKKYATGNPVVQRLLARWMGRLKGVLGTVDGTVVDVGVGEGLALERMLPAGYPAIGLEYRLDKVLAAASGCPTSPAVKADAGMLPVPIGCADLVTCIELLEHLPPFEPAVAELARITRGRCVVSVPWEPWFRLGNLGRGKNVAGWATTPSTSSSSPPAACTGARTPVLRGPRGQGLPLADRRGQAPAPLRRGRRPVDPSDGNYHGPSPAGRWEPCESVPKPV